MIVPIGAWVFAEACRQLTSWGGLDPRLRSLSMHVNVSSRQLAEPGMAEAFRAATEAAGVSPSSFVIEIRGRRTGRRHARHREGAGRAVPNRCARRPRRLRDGLRIDDVPAPVPGAHAQDRPVLRGGRGTEREDTAIVEAVINLAHTLNLEAIAEGVETVHQLAALRELGCDSVQGYVIAPPAPADEATELLLSRLDTRGDSA